MEVFSRMITKINRTEITNKCNDWLVIHYVGAESDAYSNALYFNRAYRGASAHYFVDENSIWQVVEDKDASWHVGAKKYYNDCRNTNSIGIEMCCKKDASGKWYFEKKTIENTIWLAKSLMAKYAIPIERVCRHFDVTHKICPEPFVRDTKAWREFKEKLEEKPMEDVTETEKEEKIKEFFGLDDNTVKYFRFYRYGQPLIDKLYYKAKNGLK